VRREEKRQLHNGIMGQGCGLEPFLSITSRNPALPTPDRPIAARLCSSSPRLRAHLSPAVRMTTCGSLHPTDSLKNCLTARHQSSQWRCNDNGRCAGSPLRSLAPPCRACGTGLGTMRAASPLFFLQRGAFHMKVLDLNISTRAIGEWWCEYRYLIPFVHCTLLLDSSPVY
jgi:hypothetical protein